MRENRRRKKKKRPERIKAITFKFIIILEDVKRLKQFPRYELEKCRNIPRYVGIYNSQNFKNILFHDFSF